MVNPIQQYARMPMPPRVAYPYGNMGYGGYGYGGRNRNNLLRDILLMQMMRNASNANEPSYAGGHQEARQQSSSYGGGGRRRRYPVKKSSGKKKDDDNTGEDSPTFVNGYTGIMNQNTGVIPSEGKIFSDMKKVSLNEQQLKNFVAESAIKVVKRYITEAYGDNDGYLLLDDDDNVANDDMAAPQDNKDVYTIDVFNVDADEGIDDMRYAVLYESFDEAVDAARECARSYADCGEVVCVSVMGGEFETPSGDVFGDPEVIYTISNSDEETTMNARKEAGFVTAEVDEYTE